MGYFAELPNIYYPSPLSNKISSRDLIIVKIFLEEENYMIISLIMQLCSTNILLKMVNVQILFLKNYMELQDTILS